MERKIGVVGYKVRSKWKCSRKMEVSENCQGVSSTKEDVRYGWPEAALKVIKAWSWRVVKAAFQGMG